jgi:hypothetical protein
MAANTIKAGFYAGLFTPTETSDLSRSRPDLLDEICLLRVYIRRLSSALDGRDTYVDDDLKMLNSMAVITRAVGVLMRSQASLSQGGHSPGVESALGEAVSAQREQWILA